MRFIVLVEAWLNLVCSSDNFKPESIDSTKSGLINVKRGSDSASVSVQRSSTQVRLMFFPSCKSLTLQQANEIHLFNGIEQPAKEWECVLIYDEETGVRDCLLVA